MIPEIVFQITLLVVMMILSFFFSGIEIAFVSASRLKIELKERQGSRAAGILSEFKKKTPQIIITILIGNNLALVIFTTVWNQLSQPWLEGIGLHPDENFLQFTLLQAAMATIIILILAEYIPKAIFRRFADRIVFPLAIILKGWYYLFYFAVISVNYVSRRILKYLFGVSTEDAIVELGKQDLDVYIREVIDASEHQPVPDLDTNMLTNALALTETKARECMIPRTEIECLPIEATIEEVMEKFIETHLSKLVIYGESLDEVKGFIHSSGMFENPQQIEDILQPVMIVPESMPGDMLFKEFTENKRSIAIVVDEFGGTAGMITMEDLVEEVFGEIEDEYDQEKESVVEEDMVQVRLEDGSYLLGGRLEIDDLNQHETFDLNLPDEEYYTTLGGLVMYYAEDIPKKGRTIEVGLYQIVVEKATRNRVINVRVKERESLDVS